MWKESAKEHKKSENFAAETGRSNEQFTSETFKFILRDSRP